MGARSDAAPETTHAPSHANIDVRCAAAYFPAPRLIYSPAISDILLQLLTDPSQKIRKQAVLTCCQVLVQPGKPQFVVGPSAKVRHLAKTC